MKSPLRPLFAVLLLTGAGCLHVKTDPVEVHMTVDVNVKIDRRSTTIETPAPK